MRVLLGAAVLLCLAVASQGSTTPGYQKIVRPLAEECKPLTEGSTDEDLEKVVHLIPGYSPAGKCLAACVMDKLVLMKDGTLSPPEVQLAPYKRIFADDPRRSDDAEKIIGTCYTETLAKAEGTCNIAYEAIACALRLTYV